MRRAITCLVVVALVLVCVSLLVSRPASAGPEPPTAISTADNTQRKIVRTPSGTLYVAATVNASGIPQVRVLRSDDGISWTSLPQPSTAPGWSDRAALAIDSHTSLHLVWTEPAGAYRQVFYARFDGFGWTAPEQLSDSPGYAGFPSLAVDGQDRVHVVWYGFDGSFYQIYYRRLEGTVWTPELALTNTAVDATNPAIALGPEGVVHVAWFRIGARGTDTEIAYLRLQGDIVRERLAISQPGISSVDPSIVVDGSGVVHVAWTGLVGGGDRIQYASRTSVWSSVETVSPAVPTSEHPSLSLDASGGPYLAWEGGDGQVYYQARNGTWSVPIALTSTGTNRYPTVRWSQNFNPLCGSNGKLDVLWTSELAGIMSLGYRALNVPASCPSSTPPLLDAISALGIGLVAIAILAVLLAWRHRRWYPKPPKTH